MVMIIDGHNLVPKMPGISLADVDDEAALIRFLQEYCRLRRKKVEVFFDKAPTGKAGEKNYGSVKAIFVPTGQTADDAIMARLRQLGRRAKNAQVVSSDRQVQQAAHAAHAEVITSEDFARTWQDLLAAEPELDPRNRQLSESELAAWERLFNGDQPPGPKDKI